MPRTRTPRALATPGRRVALATAYGQVALVAVLPVLTRLYPVEEFSLYQVAFALALVLQMLFSGGVEYVLPATADRGHRAALLRRGHRFLLGGTALATVVALGVAAVDRAGELLLMAVVLAAVFAYSAIDNARLLADDDTSTLVARNVLFGTAGAASQVVGGLLLPTPGVLVGGLVVARLLGVALFRGHPTRHATVPSAGPPPPGSADSAYWLVAVLLSNASLQLPVLLSAVVLGPVPAAQLALATRVVGVLGTLVGTGVAQGFTYAVARQMRERSAAVVTYIRRRQRQLAVFSVLVGVVAAATGPWVLPWVLGAQWAQAGVLVAVLGVPFSLQLVNRVTTPLFPLLHRSRVLCRLQVVRVLLLIGAIAGVTALSGPDVVAVASAVAVVMAGFYVWFYVVVHREAHAAGGASS